MKQLPKLAFSLAELMLVVAIIGCMATIAIPYYEGYTSKAKVVDIITAIDSCQTQIYKSYLQDGSLPTSITCAGNTFSYTAGICVPPTVDSLKSIKSNVYASYCLGGGAPSTYAQFILINSELLKNLTPYTLYIRFVLGANGELQSQCGTLKTDANSVPPHFLPTNCQTSFSS